MGWIWHWTLAPGLVVMAVGLTLGILVFLARPSAFLNRMLALMLVVQGLAWGLNNSIMYMRDSAAWTWAGQGLAMVLFPVVLASYMAVVSTLQTPLSRPLRSRAGGVLLVGFVLAVWAIWFVRPELFIAGIVRDTTYGYNARRGPLLAPFLVLTLAFHLYAVAVAWHAWQRADGLTRQRALSFALAASIYAGSLLFSSLQFNIGIVSFLVQFLTTVLAVLAFQCALTYGILRHQVLDIDLRIKVGISRTAVAAIIAGVAFIGSEIIEQAFDVGRLVPALVVAALSALALRPLMWIGNRLADAALPGVDDTAQYRTDRAAEIYQAALEDARRDGRVTDAERRILGGLARNLGLGVDQTRRLERAITQRTS